MDRSKDAVALKLAQSHFAIEHGIIHILRLLTEPQQEADSTEPIKLLEVNRDTTADGVSTLMLLAERTGSAALEEALLHGAGASAKDREGRTALDYLRAACTKPIVSLPEPPQMGVVVIDPSYCPAAAGRRKSEAALKKAVEREPQPR